MKSKSPLLTLEEARSNVSSFKWERYQRDFESEEARIKEVYWTIIAKDVLSTNQEAWNTTFPDRFYRSFLGTFYKANELHHRLMCAFSGISGFEWNEKQNQLKSWDLMLKKTVTSELILLNQHILTSFESGAISFREKSKEISLGQFDHYHSSLDQRISHFLCNHLRDQHSGQSNLRQVAKEVSLPLVIKKKVATKLHDRGNTIVRANATRSIIKHIETYFSSKNTLVHDEKRTASYHASKATPRRVFTAHIKVAGPTQAYNDHLSERPMCHQLSDESLTDLIMHKYRDRDGNELKRNSVRKAILKNRNNRSL